MIPQLLLLLLLLLPIVLGFGIFIGRRSIFAQNRAEAVVANTISNHLSEPFHLFNNVTLTTVNGTTQIDHILIIPSGIFVIETKHYSHWVFGTPEQKEWTQVHFKMKNRFLNPLKQNQGHINALKKLFKLPDDNFHNIVVFTGSAEFKTDPGPWVIQLFELPGFLSRDWPVILDEKKMTYIVGRIEMKRLSRSIQTDEYHINYVQSKLN
ncbi:MAG TPA: NERD domain-containing protein [Verrucomicrobiales bacterium]|nr:NERD domain-containing protein [Verrucomicrobiales bacterium]